MKKPMMEKLTSVFDKHKEQMSPLDHLTVILSLNLFQALIDEVGSVRTNELWEEIKDFAAEYGASKGGDNGKPH